jgi:hypothetical protein
MKSDRAEGLEPLGLGLGVKLDLLEPGLEGDQFLLLLLLALWLL